LSDSDLFAIATSLVQVAKLKIVCCDYLNEDAVAAALRCSTSLIDLRLELCSKVTGAKCFCPLLQEECDDGGVGGAGGGVGGAGGAGLLSGSQLTSLSLKENVSFSDEGLGHIVAHATSLTELSLSKCQRLGSHALRTINMSGLTRLSLGFLPLLDDSSLKRIARSCPLIRHFDMCGSYSVTDVGLKSVAARLGLLLYVGLSFLDKITDAGLEMLAVGCAQLEALDLEQTLITDGALEALIQYSPNLKSLNVAFCHNLSEAKIVACLQHCRLHTLNVTHCRGISHQTRFWLMAKSGNWVEGKMISAADKEKEGGDCAIVDMEAGTSALQSLGSPSWLLLGSELGGGGGVGGGASPVGHCSKSPVKRDHL
jgi:hypothetical protein